MRLSNSNEWDEAGGVLERMILTLMSAQPTADNNKDFKVALDSLQVAKSAPLRLGVYSDEFDTTIYHY